MLRKILIVAMAALLQCASLPISAWAAGAIAVVDEEGADPADIGYGVGYGENRDEAAKEAMAECRKAGNKGCKIAVRFDTCGAYAASKTHFGVGWGESKAIASSKALAECGGSCKLVVADCDE
ncbi:DUF4189 domain-containing protein [Ferrovibrio sp.]|uniref:DUF4189 domain-containing protein n=1 Tax=Ferrovibrio sp. TaxID=1917215 RepID=UPI0025B84B60|nr:DUF4189 domain-containing protein [Ferrovibrio sp.]